MSEVNDAVIFEFDTVHCQIQANYTHQYWHIRIFGPSDSPELNIKNVLKLPILDQIVVQGSQIKAKSHFGPDYTLARDVWHLTLWTEQHFGSAQLGPLHFGPSTLWLKTFWLVTFWLLTFGTK